MSKEQNLENKEKALHIGDVMGCNIIIHRGNLNQIGGCLKFNRITKEVFDEQENLIGLGKLIKGTFTVYNP